MEGSSTDRSETGRGERRIEEARFVAFVGPHDPEQPARSVTMACRVHPDDRWYVEATVFGGSGPRLISGNQAETADLLRRLVGLFGDGSTP